jgi:hypothetical protein
MTKEQLGLLDGFLDEPRGEPQPIDRSKDDELFDVIREWGQARAEKAWLHEQECETLATLGALDGIYAPHVEAKHARPGINVAGKISEITAQDKEDFARLLKYVSEWKLSIPDQGWPVAPQIVASFLIRAFSNGEDIKRLHRSISRVHQAYLDPTNDAAVRGIFEYLGRPETDGDK